MGEERMGLLHWESWVVKDLLGQNIAFHASPAVGILLHWELVKIS